jgi:hypothetical protein
MNDFTKALEAVQAVLRYLERTNDATAASLKEGMDETFTIHRLELPDILRRSLVSTNIHRISDLPVSRDYAECKTLAQWRPKATVGRYSAYGS